MSVFFNIDVAEGCCSAIQMQIYTRRQEITHTPLGQSFAQHNDAAALCAAAKTPFAIFATPRRTPSLRRPPVCGVAA
jgi:hypothetical protein